MNTDRYQRQIVLPDFGKERQELLARSKVLIVGAGGLGVPVAQYLVGMGVGHICLMDADEVSLSNLHRQVLYRMEDIGQKKVTTAQSSLQRLNPEVQIEAQAEMLTSANARSAISACDVVVDCSDNLPTRYLISDICVELGKPMVYGALYRHEGHVSVFNYHGGCSYRDVYPDEKATVDNCNEIGVLGVLPGIIGTYQALEVVKVLTGFGDPLSGKLLIVDAARSEHFVVQLSSQPRKPQPMTTPDWPEEVTWGQLDQMDMKGCHLLDVREKRAFDEKHDARFENYPLGMLTGFEPEPGKAVVLVCERGNLTRQGAAILGSAFPELKVYQVKGGYLAR